MFTRQARCLRASREVPLPAGPVVVATKNRSCHGNARRGDDLRPSHFGDVQPESPGELTAPVVHFERAAYQGCALHRAEARTRAKPGPRPGGRKQFL